MPGTLDGRYLSAEVAGGFTGMCVVEGTVHCDWFDYEPVDTRAGTE